MFKAYCIFYSCIYYNISYAMYCLSSIYYKISYTLFISESFVMKEFIESFMKEPYSELFNESRSF